MYAICTKIDVACLLSPKGLNTIGLAADIAGILILFVFGFPQPSFEESSGATLLLEGDGRESETERRNKEKRRKKLRYQAWSLFGLALIVLGFVLQIWATWAR